MYQQFAVQGSTPWQRVRTLSCIVMGLSTVVIICAIISLALVSSVSDNDHIIINFDKVKCERSFNGVTGSVCKDDINCWLCAGKEPMELKSASIWPSVIGMLTGIGICIYMMAYACNCDCVKFPEQQFQPQPQQIVQMQPIQMQPGQLA
jgi:hypothetical protein